MTAWEIALLVDTGRIERDIPVEARIKGLSIVLASKLCR